MRHLLTIILLAICGHVSLAAIRVDSYYFKKNSIELTPDSHQKLIDFVSTLGDRDIEILELSSYAESSCSDSAKQLSDFRMVHIMDILRIKGKPITINSWGNERINVKFTPLNWDRIDIYCSSDQPISPEQKSKVHDEVRSEPSSNDKEVYEPLTLNILFEGGSSKMIKETLFSLDVLYDTLKKNPLLKAHIRGHVCCDNNMRLSRKRAKAVNDFLINMGIPESRISHKGYSNSLPLVYPESDESDRRLNRRVDVIFSVETTENKSVE